MRIEQEEALKQYPLGCLPLLWQDCAPALQQYLGDSQRREVIQEAANKYLEELPDRLYWQGDPTPAWYPFKVLLQGVWPLCRDEARIPGLDGAQETCNERMLALAKALAPSFCKNLKAFQEHMPKELTEDCDMPSGQNNQAGMWWSLLLLYRNAGGLRFLNAVGVAERMGQALGLSEFETHVAVAENLWCFDLDTELEHWQRAFETAGPADGIKCAELWCKGEEKFFDPSESLLKAEKRMEEYLQGKLLAVENGQFARDFANNFEQLARSHDMPARRQGLLRVCQQVQLQQKLRDMEGVQQALQHMQEQAASGAPAKNGRSKLRR